MFARRTAWNLAPNPLAARLASRTRPWLDLTESNPTCCGFEYEQTTILSALAAPEAMRYRPHPLGLPAAREAVCAYYAERGVAVKPARVVLTASTSEAYSHLFRLLCDAGDRVHVPQPSYPLFELLGGINDVALAAYPLFYDHGWHIDVAALAARLDTRSRAILAVSPNNPTGSYVRPSEWAQLQRLAAERECALILDEVFFDYRLAPATERLMDFSTPGAALTFTLSGLSKIAALPQMKLGWMVAGGPDALVSAALERLELIADTYLSVDTPVQCGAAQLLATRHAIQPQILERLRANLATLDRLTGGVVRRLEIEGGWYAVLRVPRHHTDQQWAERLLDEADVYLHPGHFYEFPQDGYLVVSLLTPTAVFDDAIQRLVRLIE